jgi:hypothetical protein
MFLRSCGLLACFFFFFSKSTAAVDSAAMLQDQQQQQQQQHLHHRALQMGCVSTIPETVPYHIIAKHSNLVLRAMVDDADQSVVQAYSSNSQSDNWVLLPGPTPTAYILQMQGTMKKMIGTLSFFFLFHGCA